MKKILLPMLLSLATMAEAKVVLPSHFTSNMVVQQKSVLHIKGKARPGSTVTLVASWDKKGVQTQADSQGAFALEVATPKAGGPYTMTFSDGETTTLDNVLCGEVWLGSGQSNMEMPLAGWGKVLDYEKEIGAANYPQIRLLQVKKVTKVAPQDEVVLNMGGWQECSPATVDNFSALCYFYALRLWEELKVPIGVIDDDWGGTPCESWVSAEALVGVTGYKQLMRKILDLGQDETKVKAYYQGIMDDYTRLETLADKGLQMGRAPWYDTSTDDLAWPTMRIPVKWEQTPVGVMDGVVWFRRTIDIPAAWEGKDLTFCMGSIDDQDLTYWNGELIGSSQYFSEVSKYTVPGRLVKAGTTQICIRVNDTGGDGGMFAAADQMYVALGDEKVSLAGDWRYQVGLDLRSLPSKPVSLTSSHHPSGLYNAMIHPLTDFPIRGVIWYQGCSNVGRAPQHEALFQTLITDWRQRWHNPDMPFYFVQLANYLQPSDLQPDSEWALLRETQAKALALPHTGMAVNIDLGDARDIHPKTKRELGRRLSAIALNQTYGRKVAYTAPVYDGYTVEGGKVRIHLATPAGSEPLVSESDLKGFIIAGADRKWRVAKAHTEGGDIIVSHPEVKVPLAVRYGWADNPTCTLRTASGLHVAPFRTDNW